MTKRAACSNYVRASIHVAAVTLAATLTLLLQVTGTYASAETSDPRAFAEVDRIFADYALDSHIPGLVYCIVAYRNLVYFRVMGFQDLEFNRPFTPNTLFSTCSMTKAFT